MMSMRAKPVKVSVDLSSYPDLVVIYLGFRVTRLRGLATLLGLGPAINGAVASKPDGLLAHEPIIYGLTHVGMRQYWRDLCSLERFTRSEPHKGWWRDFTRENRGAGFWHETYRRAGGMEGIYLDMGTPPGFGTFAAPREPEGGYQSARGRLSM